MQNSMEIVQRGFTKLVLVVMVGLLLMSANFLIEFVFFNIGLGSPRTSTVTIYTPGGFITWIVNLLFYLGISLLAISILSGLVLLIYQLFWRSDPETSQLQLQHVPIALTTRIATKLIAFFPESVPIEDREGIASVLYETCRGTYENDEIWKYCFVFAREMGALLYLVIGYRLNLLKTGGWPFKMS